MKIGRILTPAGIKQVGSNGESWFEILDIYAERIIFGDIIPERDLNFLAPVEPRVVMGMAHNVPKDGVIRDPQAFHKSVHTITDPYKPIYMDLSLGRLEIEGELTAVISKKARDLTLENALEHVLGFTIANDVTAPDQTKIDHLLTQTKNGEGYTPLGPWIETKVENFDDISILTYINDVLVQTGSTKDLAIGVAEQLVYVTKYMTLHPGDILLGGCPMTMHAVNPGDRVKIEISGLGELVNSIVQK